MLRGCEVRLHGGGDIVEMATKSTTEDQMASSVLTIDRIGRPSFGGLFSLSRHAESRMFQRSLSRSKLARVLEFGEPIYDRGAVIYRIGKKLIAKLLPLGIDLKDLDGIHVVTVGEGVVLTVYRNREFRKAKKTRK